MLPLSPISLLDTIIIDLLTKGPRVRIVFEIFKVSGRIKQKKKEQRYRSKRLPNLRSKFTAAEGDAKFSTAGFNADKREALKKVDEWDKEGVRGKEA